MKMWLLPCNPKYYDIEGVYNNLESVDWKQSLSKVSVGDVVYIYVSAPISEIKYECIIERINKPAATINDLKFHINSEKYVNFGRYMQLKFIKKYNKKELSFEELSKNGLKGKIQCQRVISGDLEDYITRTTKI